MEVLEEVGISMQEVTDKLLNEAVKLFEEAFDKLLSAVEKKRQALLGAAFAPTTLQLPADLAAAVRPRLRTGALREGAAAVGA